MCLISLAWKKNKHDKSVAVSRASSMVKLTNRSVEITSTAELFIRSTLGLLEQTILSSAEDKVRLFLLFYKVIR